MRKPLVMLLILLLVFSSVVPYAAAIAWADGATEDIEEEVLPSNEENESEPPAEITEEPPQELLLKKPQSRCRSLNR